jgi:hypothetical protein
MNNITPLLKEMSKKAKLSTNFYEFRQACEEIAQGDILTQDELNILKKHMHNLADKYNLN